MNYKKQDSGWQILPGGFRQILPDRSRSLQAVFSQKRDAARAQLLLAKSASPFYRFALIVYFHAASDPQRPPSHPRR
jgi:hypothetical protein